MAEFASNGKGNLGVTLGAIGTGLGVLGNGIFGGGWNAAGGCCSENSPVNRYELQLTQENASLKSDIALRDANVYSDQKLVETYKDLNARLRELEAQICAQAVTNQKTADSFALASADLAAVKRELGDKIKLESERRCCADNSIVTYANATFYPKMVADITTGTGTTAQTLYNPIPNCGCDCGC